MFRYADPRVRLLGWLTVSLMAMAFSSVPAMAALCIMLAVVWITEKKGRKLLKFTMGIVPFLVVISLISLFPTFDLTRALYMSLRYYVLLGATMLVMNDLSYGELTTAIRNLKHPKMKWFDKPVEVFSLLFGLAFLTAPMTADEWSRLKEIQRTRGVDISRGNKIRQVRAGLSLLSPLVLRVLDRIRNFSIAVIMYGYNPFVPRTQYNLLTFTARDRQLAIAFASLMVISVLLVFAFKV